jgi:hypothetical protein
VPFTGVTVERIEALLYYPLSGTFSENVARDSISLWNTPIGRGIATSPSSDTFIKVIVAGPAGAYMSRVSLRLEVRAGTRLVVSRTRRVGFLSTAGRTTLGFWVYDTGCEPLTITARLQAADSNVPVIVARVPFECGE